MEQNKNKIQNALVRLEKIVAWFESQEEADVEEGLRKVREGAALIKELNARLKDVENEFEEIKQSLAEERDS